MQITGISSNSAGYAGTGTAGRGAGSASFADLLQISSTEAQAQAIMKQRVAAVGLAGYAREQQEMKKLMRVLTLVQAEAAGEVKAALGGIVDGLQRNLPATPKDIYARLESYIAELPPGTSDDLKAQLQDALARIKELAAKSDGALDELDALMRRRSDAAARRA